ncbi:hypothetical protein YPPY64_1468, partial [Yersinia pestis PY-64]
MATETVHMTVRFWQA